MQMTDKEICKEYREAKNPNNQIKILAELNSTTVENVVEILKANNEPLRKRPYNRKAEPVKVFNKGAKKVKAPEQILEVKELPIKQEPLPASVMLACRDRIIYLAAQIGRIQEQLETVKEELNDYKSEHKELCEYFAKHGGKLEGV